jgi:glutamate-1-semialdehyde 2,1-aminomutase
VKAPGAAAWDDRPGRLAGQLVEVLSWNRADFIEERLSRGDVAAVIMEPAMCNTGAIFPGPGYLETVREICRKTGTVLIFDEVITGFRVGPGGAQEKLGVTPDLTIFGKAVASGFPVAGSLVGRPHGLFATGKVTWRHQVIRSP